jgi:hypothetical protein
VNQSLAADSLVTGKRTGYFRDSEAAKQNHRADRSVNWEYLLKFPAKRNSVFSKLDQGTKNQIRD